MTTDQWLRKSAKSLLESDIPTARLDCLLILGFVLSKDKAWVLAHPEDVIRGNQLLILNKLVVQRSRGKPISYITKQAYFYGHLLRVSDSVLIPRPESESIIDILSELDLNPNSVVIDIGTGSGALAIAAKHLFPNVIVLATDIDTAALEVAGYNAKIIGAKIDFFQSDLLDQIPKKTLKYSVILANLPYVPNDFPINSSAKYEPQTAIFGGQTGVEIYAKLFSQISLLEDKPTFIITESLSFQHSKLSELAASAGYLNKQSKGLVQLFSLRHL